MKNNIILVIGMSLLFYVLTACGTNATTAKIGSFNIGKNEKAEPPDSIFNLNEKVYIVTTASNAIGKYKMRFKVYYENVSLKKKGEEALSKDIDFEGSRPVNLSFDAVIPGEFRAEAILLDESGREIDKKSGNFTIKADASVPATTETKKLF